MTSANAMSGILEHLTFSSKTVSSTFEVSSKKGARLTGLWLFVLGTSVLQTALAQTSSGELGAGSFQISSPDFFAGTGLSHEVSLSVPVRLGLYLNRNFSSFPENPETDCYLAATRNEQSGDVTRLDLAGALAGAVYSGDGEFQGNNTYSYPGEFSWGSLALERAAPTRTLPLLCLSRTVVSTYVNKVSGWRLTALYQAAQSQGAQSQGASRPLLVALRFPSSTLSSSSYSSGASLQPAAPDYLSSGISHDLLRSSQAVTTAGWQDVFFLLGMLFEGGLPTPASQQQGLSVTKVTLGGQPLEVGLAPPASGSISLSIADLDQP